MVKIVVSAALLTLAAGDAGVAAKDILLDVDQAKAQLGKPGVVFIFAGSAQDFAKGRVPGSVHAFAHDMQYLDDVARCDGLPMCPDTAARFLGGLGITNDSEVIAYENGVGVNESGIWFFLKLYGHDRVRIMEGGLPAWQAKGYPVENGKAAAVAAKTFTVRTIDRSMIATRADVEKALASKQTLLLDARHRIEEYVGTALLDGMKNAKEEVIVPRGGHIPGAVFSPWTKYAANKGGEVGKPIFRPAGDLTKQLTKLGKNGYAPDRTIISYCHVGLGRSTFQYLGLKLAGHQDVRVYVGSWSEWGNTSAPIETTH